MIYETDIKPRLLTRLKMSSKLNKELLRPNRYRSARNLQLDCRLCHDNKHMEASCTGALLALLSAGDHFSVVFLVVVVAIHAEEGQRDELRSDTFEKAKGLGSVIHVEEVPPLLETPDKDNA